MTDTINGRRSTRPSTVGLAEVRRDIAKRWVEATPRTRATIQVGVCIAAVVGAYNYTLLTLLQNVGLETPLAYVSLVPVIALFLAAVKREPKKPEPAIYDRQLDYIVGIPLIGAALTINLVLPHQLSVMYWVYRLDLLSLPLFVAGVVAIIFGVRVLWRQKLAIGFLFLAWPYPYSWFLLGVLTWFTNTTVRTLNYLVGVIHVATPIAGSGGLFSVAHHHTTFPLSVVSACSGVNSVVGFVLIGASFIAVVHGPLMRKIPWLVGGMLVIWSMNIVRLMFIFWAGQRWGEHIAISILHPFVGLVTFSLGVLFMIALIRPLGMTIGSGPLYLSTEAPVSSGAPSRRGLAVPTINAAIAVVIIAGTVLGILDVHLKQYNLVANSAGEPTLASFDTSAAVAPVGFVRTYNTAYTWATPYFGDNSTWVRYVYSDNGASRLHGKDNLRSNEPVWEDVIDTTDLNSFSAYGIEACYTFHGYTLRDVADVNLGGGITGQTLAYQTPQQGAWSIVYWIVPVVVAKSTHFERIVLYLENTATSRVIAPSSLTGVQNLSGSLADLGASGKVLVENRNFLVTFARRLIAEQARHKVVVGPA